MRVTATPDKCRAINDSCRDIAVIAAVDVDHCTELLVAFDRIRCFATAARAGRFVNPCIYCSFSTHSINDDARFYLIEN